MSLFASKDSSLGPTRTQQQSIAYNTNKFRKGNFARLGNNLTISLERNDYPVKLVPVRLDIEVDGLKIRDCFTWNLYENLMTPEQFAQLLIDDLVEHHHHSYNQVAYQIANSIRQQCEAWQGTVGDYEDQVFAVDDPNIEDLHQESEWRTIIKLDMQVGDVHLNDQFEWPLTPQNYPVNDEASTDPSVDTPESFAKRLCEELGIGGEWVSSVAHQIREQICYARINFDDVLKMDSLPVDSKTSTIMPFRVDCEDYGPQLEFLDPEELERREKELDRTSRRLRRSQKNEGNFIVLNRHGYDNDTQESSRFSRRFQQSQQQQQRQSNVFQQNNAGMPSFNSAGIVNQQYNFGIANIPGAVYQRTQQPAPLPKQGASTSKVPYRNYKPTPEEEALVLKKMEETIKQNALLGQLGSSPPKGHRGFGASAQKFNADGSLEVGEFRSKWRCSWCLLSGKFTPTLRKGPGGSKTLCNACGIWYGKHGSLPQDRYHEHANDPM
ncbi:hypothetical protein MP228_008842 [Amoeboaphelidium protococcarum]|nr:hypothetical protein MP228_008842 [Amoeboaphelidium protococcarum]